MTKQQKLDKTVELLEEAAHILASIKGYPGPDMSQRINEALDMAYTRP